MLASTANALRGICFPLFMGWILGGGRFFRIERRRQWAFFGPLAPTIAAAD
jgi:hypothetical protein